MHTFYRLASIAILCLIVAACGGGNSSTSPPSTSLDLSRLSRPEAGDAMQFELSGTFFHQNGGRASITGVASREVGNPTTFDGRTAYPVIETINFVNLNTGGRTRTKRTNYVTADGVRLGSESDTGVVCLVDSSDALPRTVKRGDSGFWYNETCTDGLIFRMTWQAAQFESGTWILTFNADTNVGGITANQESWEFDSEGKIVNFRLRGTLSAQPDVSFVIYGELQSPIFLGG